MKSLTGIIAAAVTPVRADLTVDESKITTFLSILDRRGCHGALLLGTTGEGPSFSIEQRKIVMRAAVAYQVENPNFILLAGTGMTSLEDTLQLTQFALQVGFDGVVVLPPYYYTPSLSALLAWFRVILEQAVPEGKWLLGYHFPRMTGVPLSLDLLQTLAGEYPGKFAGVKDSSADGQHLENLLSHLPADFAIFPGHDRLLSAGLSKGAAGTISSLTNLAAPLSRRIWDDTQAGAQDSSLQSVLDDLRQILDQHPPAPAFLKALLPLLLDLPEWQVCPPLAPFTARETEMIRNKIESSPAFHWLRMEYGPAA